MSPLSAFAACAGAACAALVLAAGAQARQWDPGLSMIESNTQNMMNSSMINLQSATFCSAYGQCQSPGRTARADGRRQAGLAPQDRFADRRSVPSRAETRYAPSSAITREVEADFYDGLRQRDPRAAAEVETVLREYDIIAEFDSVVRPFGRASGDLADALAAYWVLNWMHINGLKNEPSSYPSRQAVVSVRDTLAREFVSSPDMAALSESDRQRLAESLIYNFIFQHSVWTLTSRPGYEAQFDQLAQSHRGHMRNLLGVDLATLDLNAQGFTPR